MRNEIGLTVIFVHMKASVFVGVLVMDILRNLTNSSRYEPDWLKPSTGD